MKWLAFFLTLFICFHVSAQPKTDSTFKKVKFVSFNLFSLLEPPMAFGVGFGNRWTKRSGFFSEIAYLIPNPLYPNNQNGATGFRFIAQYRSHILKARHRLLFLHSSEEKLRMNNLSFAAVEFRAKNYLFSATSDFVNQTAGDTLRGYVYSARATVIGGAVLWGNGFLSGANGKWRVEITSGIGIKHKFIRFKNVPAGFVPVDLYPKREWAFGPKAYDQLTTPYFPFTLRLQYKLN